MTLKYYQIDPDLLIIISGPYDLDSPELRKITRCGTPELLDLSKYNIVPELKDPLGDYQYYTTPEVYLDHVRIPICDKTEVEIAEDNLKTLQVKRDSLVCTPRQIRLALVHYNLLNTVQTYIDQLEDSLLKIEWEYAINFNRSHPGISQAAQACGFSETDLDALFEFAQTL